MTYGGSAVPQPHSSVDDKGAAGFDVSRVLAMLTSAGSASQVNSATDVSSAPGLQQQWPISQWSTPQRPALQWPGLQWPAPQWLAQTGSTNDDLAAAVDETTPPWTVLGAELQTAGHGRLGRAWVSPPGASLSFSVLVRPSFDADLFSWLTPMAALAVVQTLDACGVKASIKWPNDVVAERNDGAIAKICGILARAVPSRKQPQRPDIVMGIGLNVSQSIDELPVSTATSLALSGASCCNREELLAGILVRLRAFVEGFGVAEVRQEVVAGIESRMRTLGSLVRAELPNGNSITGTATGLGEDGSLILTAAGERTAITAADIVHLRLATLGDDASTSQDSADRNLDDSASADVTERAGGYA